MVDEVDKDHPEMQTVDAHVELWHKFELWQGLKMSLRIHILMN